MRSFILSLLYCLLPVVASAECKIYTVKKGDTYGDISKYYFKDGFHKFYLEKYNKSAKLVPGKKVAFFIPEHISDSYSMCTSMINSRLTKQKAHKKLNEFLEGIPLGLATVAAIAGEGGLDPVIAVDLCAFALAVAEINTDFGRKKGPKDTLSVYAFPKNIPTKIFDEFNLTAKFKELDIKVNDSMEQIGVATFVFIIYFTDLWADNKSIFRALLKYYGRDKDLSLDALNTFKIYLDILEPRYVRCSVDEVETDE